MTLLIIGAILFSLGALILAAVPPTPVYSPPCLRHEKWRQVGIGLWVIGALMMLFWIGVWYGL